MSEDLPGLDALIAETGLDPVEWDFRTLCDSIKEYEEWKKIIKAGRYPPELDPETAKETIQSQMESLKEECRSWRDYRLPKRKAHDVRGTMTVPVVQTQDASDVDL